MALKKPIKAQLDKLPAWAREYIKSLEGERDVAVRTLLDFQDTATPTNIYTRDNVCLGETGTGPQEVRNYLQARRVYFKLPREHPDDWGMEVFVNEKEQRVEVRTPAGYPYISPQGSNLFYIVSRESDMVPNAKLVLKSMQEADKLSHDDFTSKYGFSQAALPQMIAKVLGKE
jgi:hypothetical protein